MILFIYQDIYIYNNNYSISVVSFLSHLLANSNLYNSSQ